MIRMIRNHALVRTSHKLRFDISLGLMWYFELLDPTSMERRGHVSRDDGRCPCENDYEARHLVEYPSDFEVLQKDEYIGKAPKRGPRNLPP